MEEKRNIKVSFNEAIELYNSDNATLRELALTAYAESELAPDINCIYSKVGTSHFYTAVPIDEDMKYRTLAKLAIIAKYFNGDWKKTANNTGYFIGEFIDNSPYPVSSYNGIGIYAHASLYAGVIYFKNLEDIIQAIKFLGERVKDLF